MTSLLNIDYITVGVFVVLFGIFSFLGFFGSRWRRGDMNLLNEWGLGGRRLGTLLVWFLMGADLFTAYTFIAVPSLLMGSGPIGFYAVPYVAWGFAVALLTMPRLWTVSRNKGYVTAADFVKGRFNSRGLAIAVALTGTVATLPYIALQIVGMQAVLAVLIKGLTGAGNSFVSDVSLIIAFVILAVFVFTSGLRGAALTGVMKDVLVWITVLTVIVAVPLYYGGFAHAFANAKLMSPTVNQALNGVKTGAGIGYLSLPSSSALEVGYLSLAMGSALALYLYPHAINGSLSSESREKLIKGTALLPIYGIGLALIALFGVLIYANPAAVNIVVGAKSGALAVPALIATSLPDWFVGIAFVAIFIGGLVPAAIMAIAVANLLTRNVIKEFKRDLSPRTETTLAKWISTIFKFVALLFVFIVPATYAIQLQLLGGVIISQTLPAVFLGLYTDKMHPKALLVGWAAGILSGLGLLIEANYKFGLLKTSFYTTPVGLVYTGILSLAVNLVVVALGTAIAMGTGWRPASQLTSSDILEVNKEQQ